MFFSELEKKALEFFVTSTEDPIYAVKHTVPPEVFGALAAYFSRNPKDFREHLLDAIYGTIDEGKGLFRGEEELPAHDALNFVANKSLDPALALVVGLVQSQNFYKKWYGGWGHKSIANDVWIPMVGTNVSQLFARELAYDQLAFFIEQSSRYVQWDKDKMFLDTDIINSKHADSFISGVEQLVEGYYQLTECTIEYYKAQNPFNEWLEKQPKKIQQGSDKLKQRTYERQIQGAALDISRFLLPQAARTNIAWILDVRSTEFDIAAWKGHPLAEIREDAVLIEKHAGMIAPSLLKYTEKNDYYARKLNGYDGAIKASSATSFEKGVDVISYESDSLNKVVAHLLKRHNFGGTFRQRYKEARSMRFPEKISILEKVVQDRGPHDEWTEMDEEFDLVKATFEIRTDIGATRDLRRHQKNDRSEALYTTENGFYKPPMIANMNPNASKIFDIAVNVASMIYEKIVKDLPYQAQYIVPMATRHTITMSAGLDQIQYLCHLRSTPKGNFSYRQDAFNLAEAFAKTHPWVLGYKTYPKRKSFMKIYEEAPLKGFLKLQTEETALHT